MLLTTLSVSCLESAVQCLKWYSYRWLIERYHYCLKSGCKIKELQLENGERIKRALATYAIVAWRLLWLTYVSVAGRNAQARNHPERTVDGVLQPHEWQALYCKIHKTNIPSSEAPSLGECVRWIAQLGGFLGRKGDGEPGVKTLWRGLKRLHDIGQMWQLMEEDKEDWDNRNISNRVVTVMPSGLMVENGQEIFSKSYFEAIGKLLSSKDLDELAVRLFAPVVTDRRPHEILAHAKFTAIEGEEYKVMFEGQEKRRGEGENQRAVVHKLLEMVTDTVELKERCLRIEDLEAKVKELTQENQKLNHENEGLIEENKKLTSQIKDFGKQADKLGVLEDIELKIERIIEEKLSTMMHNNKVIGVHKAKVITNAQSQAKTVKADSYWESVSSEDLKKSKRRGVVFEKLRRSYLAIISHNDHKAGDNNGQPDVSKMWAITNQALRQQARV